MGFFDKKNAVLSDKKSKIKRVGTQVSKMEKNE
jgi:hypothetical protein